MDRKSVAEASTVALAALLAWWGGVLHLDGALAQTLSYDRYEAISLLYPDVFYPALPGWILAHAQPFSAGFWPVVVGWMVVLALGIGAAAASYASRRDRSPTVAAVASVGALFIAVTAAEAALFIA